MPLRYEGGTIAPLIHSSSHRAAHQRPERTAGPAIIRGSNQVRYELGNPETDGLAALRRVITLAPLTLTLSHKGRGDQSGGNRGIKGKGTNKNRSPRAAVFLLGQPVGANRATGLRRGASWFCRRCLPARFPSR